MEYFVSKEGYPSMKALDFMKMYKAAYLEK
jgi:hypothetical protein